jgi:hypothetical protein
MIRRTYLIVTMTMRAQSTRETTPNTASRVSAPPAEAAVRLSFRA